MFIVFAGLIRDVIARGTVMQETTCRLSAARQIHGMIKCYDFLSSQ